MVIPTYWTGPDEEWTEGDAVYDHATPLNSTGTLHRTLESLNILDDKHFTLIILAASTNPKYVKPMEEKLTKMLQETDLPVDTILFTDSTLKELKKVLYKDIDLPDVLELRGYSNIRNLCLFIPYILGAEVAILIDDDEISKIQSSLQKQMNSLEKDFMEIRSLEWLGTI